MLDAWGCLVICFCFEFDMFVVEIYPSLPAVYCCDVLLPFNWASTTDVESNDSRDTVIVMGMELKLIFNLNFHLNFKVEFIFCC